MKKAANVGVVRSFAASTIPPTLIFHRTTPALAVIILLNQLLQPRLESRCNRIVGFNAVDVIQFTRIFSKSYDVTPRRFNANNLERERPLSIGRLV
jgi:hypothetical protein